MRLRQVLLNDGFYISWCNTMQVENISNRDRKWFLERIGSHLGKAI